MPTVDITPADHAVFASCAAAAGLTVDQWLTDAGRAQASAAGRGRASATEPGAAPIGLDDLWAATVGDLTEQVPSRLRPYLAPARLTAIVEGVALLAVPDAVARDVLESRLRPAIVEALHRRVGTSLRIAVTVAESPLGGGRPRTGLGRTGSDCGR
jgi:hypothetical protein